MKKVEFVAVEKDEMQGIDVEGYTNTWSAFDKAIVDDEVYYILENDKWGDETYSLVVNAQGEVICETYDDIEIALEDEDII